MNAMLYDKCYDCCYAIETLNNSGFKRKPELFFLKYVSFCSDRGCSEIYSSS